MLIASVIRVSFNTKGRFSTMRTVENNWSIKKAKRSGEKNVDVPPPICNSFK